MNVSRYVVIVTFDDRGRKRGCGRGNGTRRESRGIAKTKRTTRRYRGGCKSLLYFLSFLLYFVLSSVALFFLFCLAAASVCTCVRVIIVIRLWVLIRIHQIQNNANSPNIVILFSVFSIFLRAFTCFT